MFDKSVLDLSDEELAVEASHVIARALSLLDEYGRRHPELPMWHLLAMTLRNSPHLQNIEEKRRLLKMPPAGKKKH